MAVLNKSEIDGIKFFYRKGNSDLKTFEEVLRRKTYKKGNFDVQPGETWYDLGGNVGAFALYAISRGANVVIYEPDPNCCKMIEKNLFLNGYDATIINKALTAKDKGQRPLFSGRNNQSWRNSLEKKWSGVNSGRIVQCSVFDDEIPNNACVKMDIEGSEMKILETTEKVFSKLVYEWSFDIDPSLERFWSVINRQKKSYKLDFPISTTKYETRSVKTWQPSWFPACVNVFCQKQGKNSDA